MALSDLVYDTAIRQSLTIHHHITGGKFLGSLDPSPPPVPLSKSGRQYDTIRYDTIEEFNVDSKAECDQRNIANVARKKYKKKKLKQTIASAHLVQYGFKIREGSPEGIRVTMEEIILVFHFEPTSQCKTCDS